MKWYTEKTTDGSKRSSDAEDLEVVVRHCYGDERVKAIVFEVLRDRLAEGGRKVTRALEVLGRIATPADLRGFTQELRALALTGEGEGDVRGEAARLLARSGVPLGGPMMTPYSHMFPVQQPVNPFAYPQFAPMQQPVNPYAYPQFNPSYQLPTPAPLPQWYLGAQPYGHPYRWA